MRLGKAEGTANEGIYGKEFERHKSRFTCNAAFLVPLDFSMGLRVSRRRKEDVVESLGLLLVISMWICIFAIGFFAIRNYVYSHPSPAMQKLMEQNQTLIRRVEELEEKIEMLLRE